jgi:hypothetical protein
VAFYGPETELSAGCNGFKRGSKDIDGSLVALEVVVAQPIVGDLSEGKNLGFVQSPKYCGCDCCPELVNQHQRLTMALVVPDKNAFQHILRLLNTNVDGKDKIMFALTKIKGVGRRYSNVVIKKVAFPLRSPNDFKLILP